jgi:FixJ family two-component response regulator
VRDAGARGFINKPLNRQQLTDVVASALSGEGVWN